MKYDDTFLELIKPSLDESQRQALANPGNTVIAAGAGSGKTQVLATRFAWLVLTGQAQAPEILTLTFTNKAASEMYQRIYKTLRFYAEQKVSDKLTVQQIQRAKDALQAFSDVHIQTLDSYCSSIVRQCANRYGIKPDFTTGSGDGERLVKDEAFKFILQNTENSGVQVFADAGRLQYFAENVFAKVILEYTSLATEKGWFVKKLEDQKFKLCESWNKIFLTQAENMLGDLVGKVTQALNDTPNKGSEKTAPYEQMIHESEDLYDLIAASPKLKPEDIENQSESALYTANLIRQFCDLIDSIPANKGYIQDVRPKVKEIKERTKLYNSMAVYVIQYTAIKELNKLFDIFLEKINLSKRISGNLSFVDVSELALKILMENEDIRNQEKRRFRKIMIDEFQDNNGKNRNLLYLLALKDGEFEDNGKYCIKLDNNQNLHDLIITSKDGEIIDDKRKDGKLFFVGDEKQSIYKFRGADVTVFNELTSTGENSMVFMTYNYRSSVELIKTFNTIFKNGKGIFDTYSENDYEDFEAYYQKDALKKDKELPELTAENIPIHFCMFDTNEITKNNEELLELKKNLLPEKDQTAYFIAERIYNLHQKKGIDWKDFAILDRTRTDRSILIKYLSLFDIPYTIDVYKDIFQDGIVNDFYNFLRICVYPSDVNAFAAYLTSPLAGLSENSVEIIISHLNSIIETEDGNWKQYNFNPLDQKDDLISADLSKSEFDKFVEARRLFCELKPQVLKQRLTTTLSYLWNDCGYKYETMLNDKLFLSAEQFDMLFELARQADESGKSPAWFIDQLAIIKNSNFIDESDMDAGNVSYPYERGNAIQIMTVHKSKGLQFEQVFIYGFTDISSKNSTTCYTFNEETGVSIKPEKGIQNFFYLNQSEEEQLKELAELRRVIYVAITRAISEVYLVGYMNLYPKSESKSIFRLIETAVNFYYSKHIPAPGKKCFSDEAGFDLFNIRPVTYENLKNISSRNPDAVRKELYKKASELYEKARLIEYECKAYERLSPSGLEKGYDESESEEPDSSEKYEQSSDILKHAGFTAADFGTLVHSYLEMQAKGIAPADYEPEPKLFKNLSQAKIDETIEICQKMCAEFEKSEIGLSLKDAQNKGRFWRAEWGFRMFWKCDAAPDGAIFTGSIDLIYENADGTYTICDYKSDTEIDSEKYRGQQESYRAAASKLLKISEEKINLNLYFLKHNQIVKL